MKEDMQEKLTFKVYDESGVEIDCEVLFTFESERTNRSYIVYTDNTLDDEGNTKLYASTYNPYQDATKLYPIETEAEWTMIEEILEELKNSLNEE